MLARAVHVDPPRAAAAADHRIAGRAGRWAASAGQRRSSSVHPAAASRCPAPGPRARARRCGTPRPAPDQGRRRGARVQHRHRLERLGAGPVEHRSVHIAPLPEQRTVPVEDHQRAVVRALVQSRTGRSGPAPRLGPGAGRRCGRADPTARRGPDGRGPRRTPVGALMPRPPRAPPTGARMASMRSRSSRPRCSTISATPRPLTRASWATSVAFS